jgi:uncharacterized protein (TIGR00297 family)
LDLPLGFLQGLLIGWLAWRMGALSSSGAWAAAITGGLVFGLGGLEWAVLLLAFFTSSSALSRVFARRKADLAEKYSKGERRDWGQVLANGGVGALLALSSALFSGEVWPWIAYAGAMAAVNADTWATELGVFSPWSPRLITTGKLVERGTSGGVTLHGYLAALAGSALIGGLAVWMGENPLPAGLPLWIAVTLAGVAGSTFDSWLGASLQAIYYCPQCNKETERSPRHTCGTPTVFQHGWRWLNNDWVNFLCSLAGAATAYGLWLWMV